MLVIIYYQTCGFLKFYISYE